MTIVTQSQKTGRKAFVSANAQQRAALAAVRNGVTTAASVEIKAQALDISLIGHPLESVVEVEMLLFPHQDAAGKDTSEVMMTVTSVVGGIKVESEIGRLDPTRGTSRLTWASVKAGLMPHLAGWIQSPDPTKPLVPQETRSGETYFVSKWARPESVGAVSNPFA
jgi:hypothetical protein